MKRRKPIACLLSACRRKTCGTRARPNSAAGRRGRRRSAYEAPRAAADRGTPLGGAESKRRRRPRLPAPPSWVTLLGAASSAKARHHRFGEEPHRADEEVVWHAARPHPEQQPLHPGVAEPRDLLGAPVRLVEEEHVLEPVLVGVLRQPSAPPLV